VNPKRSRRFNVKIRVPNREVSDLYTNQPKANGITSIKVNGELVQPAIKNGYAVINRKWRTGDTIDIVLPMVIQRVKGTDKIEATRGQVALRYGPLIYSAEAVDQDITKTLSPDARLTIEWQPDLLEGVMVIKGKWSDGSDFMAIPNYARSNRFDPANSEDSGRRSRGLSSTVWLKDVE
jgi:DUF1680 family protein